jgi:hypothetical protein
MVRPSPSTVEQDPLIAEIRAVKDAVSARYGHDVRRMCQDLRRQQASNAKRVVRRQERLA